NVAESLQRGMRVVVQGRLKARSYETREGEKRTVFEIDVDEVGPSLKYATAKVTKATRSGGGGGYAGGQQSGQQASQGDDPWASGGNAGGNQGGSWGGQQAASSQGSQGAQSGGQQSDPWATPAASDEPPF
ncbi:MAG: single-stranded DNA-binding protein, partial [Actinomycetota bacterium]|nr:single-stranded DNA-binding protein [Actinomycetota bacterium]